MGNDLKELKSVLRSLVGTSPKQMDVRTLLRDYRKIIGEPMPHAKYGYLDPLAFLKEQCGDCFSFHAPPSNPVLTLIVPDTLKHTDQLVPFISKNGSVPETSVMPPRHHNTKYIKHTLHNANSNYTHHNSNSTKYVKKKNDNQNKTGTSNDVKNSHKRVAFSFSQNNDSGKHTTFSRKIPNVLQFEKLKSEILELIRNAPQGVWCTDLISLYRERYNRELDFIWFGFTSIISLVSVMEQSVQITRLDDTGNCLLQEKGRATAAPPPAVRPSLAEPARPVSPAPSEFLRASDIDQALPGINFDYDVFPDDCVHFMECIPSMSLADIRPGATLGVIVGEVYSPSHFWLIRLGENYSNAMEDLIDEMTLYYNGEGRDRVLERGALRIGHYCSTLFDSVWHRSLIVKIVDSDTVKVRHVDYGTVDTVAFAALRPLRREWARLPAQAVRARLFGVRPWAAAQSWPHAAAQYFLRVVREKRFVADVVAVDLKKDLIETLLIDKSGAEGLSVSSELIRAGHADARPNSALWTVECYLYPTFEALENGDTPNFGEIHAFLRDGVRLSSVQAYRLHVPLCMPPDSAAQALPPPAPLLQPPAPTLPPPVPLSLLPAPASRLWPGEPAPPVSARLHSTRARSASLPSLLAASSASLRQQREVPNPARRAPAPPLDPRSTAATLFSAGLVALSVADCSTYCKLVQKHPPAAHWYILGAMRRAIGAPPLPYASMHPPHPSMQPPQATMNPPHTSMHPLHATMYPPHPSMHPLHATMYPPHPPMHPPHTSMHPPHASMNPPGAPMHPLSVSIRPPPGFGGVVRPSV